MHSRLTIHEPWKVIGGISPLGTCQEASLTENKLKYIILWAKVFLIFFVYIINYMVYNQLKYSI